MNREFTPFVAASMREMLLDMLEKHPEIFDRPTRYPEGRAEFLKQKELNTESENGKYRKRWGMPCGGTCRALDRPKIDPDGM